MVLGVRGMPNVQGGVETHAEQLYERLATLGCDVEVLVRTPFVPPGQQAFGSIRIRRLWAPRKAGFEALVHSVIGVLYAGLKRPDVLHIHSIGPAIVTPLARLFGLKVVVTYHSQNYEHEKWGGLARWLLRTGERFGMRCSNARIAISKLIAGLIRSKHGRDSFLIPNGVVPPTPASQTDVIEGLGLQPGRYFLQVGRISHEKRQLDLVNAFGQGNIGDWKLVLVGGLDASPYSQEVEKAAREANVVLAGFQKGVALAQLYSHAGGFILPSSNEGLPIALLEAMSYGLPVLASDIPPNLELALPQLCYFPMGNVPALAAALERMMSTPRDAAASAARRQWVIDSYDWNRVAADTLRVYRSVTGQSVTDNTAH